MKLTIDELKSELDKLGEEIEGLENEIENNPKPREIQIEMIDNVILPILNETRDIELRKKFLRLCEIIKDQTNYIKPERIQVMLIE